MKRLIPILAIILTMIMGVCFAETNITIGDNAVFQFGNFEHLPDSKENDYRGDANMTFDHVLHTPPEGGDAQEMLRVSGASFRLVPITDPEISDRIFSVWVQSNAATEIEIIGGETDVTMNVGTTWSRITTELDGATDVVITVPSSATVYFYKAQLEIGNHTTDWKAAPEDDDEIGGRNLLPKEKYYAENITDIVEHSVSGYGFSAMGPLYEVPVFGQIGQLSLERDAYYILSFTAWIDSDDPTARQALEVDLYPDDLPQINYTWENGITPTPTRYKWFFKSSSANMESCALRFFNDQATTYDSRTCYLIHSLYITDIQLEKGNHATDWTPAPEDYVAQINDLGVVVDENTDKLRSMDALRVATRQEPDGLYVRPVYKDAAGEWVVDENGMYTRTSNGSFRIIDPLSNDSEKRANGSWIALPSGSIIDDAVIENIPGVCVIFRMREVGDGA